jgi:dTDP-4-amino-4,6-dideoxygalactose transaminase
VKPFDIVAAFESTIADFAGARYGVAVDSCTSGIFLCCKYLDVKVVQVPQKTYISVPMAIIHAGGKVLFKDVQWKGVYQLQPYPLWDGAKRFQEGMFEGGFHCLSFHVKKHINIGRGGIILTDDLTAVKWLRKARYDGRDGKFYPNERVTSMGWHCYMTPEQAARGLHLFHVRDNNLPDQEEDYPDLRLMPVFQSLKGAVNENSRRNGSACSVSG